VRRVIFGGAPNSVSKMFITGGTAQFEWIQFDQGTNPGGGTQIEEVTVDGGDLILTGNETGAFDFAGAYSKVFYENGSITFTGVDTVADFNAFTNTWNGWVDTGSVTSTVYSASELKSMLQYSSLGDAVVTPVALQAYGTMMISLGADSMEITSDYLNPAATNMLQETTDLVNGSWSNVSFSTGSTSNSWVITPLTEPKSFYRVISQ